jgi:hypothetical protein
MEYFALLILRKPTSSLDERLLSTLFFILKLLSSRLMCAPGPSSLEKDFAPYHASAFLSSRSKNQGKKTYVVRWPASRKVTSDKLMGGLFGCSSKVAGSFAWRRAEKTILKTCMFSLVKR